MARTASSSVMLVALGVKDGADKKKVEGEGSIRKVKPAALGSEDGADKEKLQGDGSILEAKPAAPSFDSEVEEKEYSAEELSQERIFDTIEAVKAQGLLDAEVLVVFERQLKKRIGVGPEVLGI